MSSRDNDKDQTSKTDTHTHKKKHKLTKSIREMQIKQATRTPLKTGSIVQEHW